MIWDWIFCFFLYSVIGWLFESTVVSINQKKIINRGFFIGPICPIYGTGGVLMAGFLMPLQGRLPETFLAGMLLATALEFVVGWGMERFFHARWWDYSQHRFNIKGYVCLSSSLVWGAFSIILVELLHPLAMRLTLWVPEQLRIALCGAAKGVFVVDAWLSLRTAIDMDRWVSRFADLRRKVEERVSQSYVPRMERGMRGLRESVAHRLHLPSGEHILNVFRVRMLRAYPRMRSTRYPEAIAQMQKRLNQAKNEWLQWRQERKNAKKDR